MASLAVNVLMKNKSCGYWDVSDHHSVFKMLLC